MAFGLTSLGFSAKTLTDVRASLNAGFRSVFGLAVNVDPRSRNGQLIGIFSEAIVEVWQLAEALDDAFNPRSATGILLDLLCALTGTTRRAAFPSSVELLLTGTPTTLVPAAKQAQVNGTSTKFATIANATIAAATAWVNTTTYALGVVRTNSGNIYKVITPGQSAGSGGPTTTAADITDGTCHWQYVGLGTGFVAADALATTNGKLHGYAGSITVIDTPVSGWAGVFNPLDAVTGALLETDGELRLRREQELGAQGSSPLPGIRAAILDVDDVTTCSVYENITDNTVDGQGPHSFEALVEGGDNTEIAETIFASKAGGIAATGNTSVGVVDSQGNPFTIGFSRPENVDAYVEVTLTEVTGEYPADGNDEVKAVIVAAGALLALGRDLVPALIAAHVIFHTTAAGAAVGIPGVVNVTVRVHTTGAYQTTPVVLTNRQRAIYDTSRVVVIATAGTP